MGVIGSEVPEDVMGVRASDDGARVDVRVRTGGRVPGGEAVVASDLCWENFQRRDGGTAVV